jgi:hypothetical protein
MSKRVDFQAKTDRELLLLTAQATNEMSDQLKKLNGSVKENQRLIAHNTERIIILEANREAQNPASNPSVFMKVINKGKTPGLVIGIAGLLFTGVYSLGQVMGWW